VTIQFNFNFSKADLLKALVFVAGGGLAGFATALSKAFPTEEGKILAYSSIVTLVAGALLHVLVPSQPSSSGSQSQ
jgi:hypothetical protein